MKTVDFAGNHKSPSKVVCIGRNYAEHVAELGNPLPDNMVIFFKPNASISNELRAVAGEPVHYEAEICFGVEGGEFRYVGFGLDLTKRDLQAELKGKGLPWERSKAFRGSAVFGSFVPLRCSVDALSVELMIDGVRAQFGTVAEMIHKPESMLEEVATFTDLEDFDIVMSGTPKGVGCLKTGSDYEGVIRVGDIELVRTRWKAV